MSHQAAALAKVFDDAGRQICRWCHSPTPAETYRPGRDVIRFCSQKCAQESARQRKIARGLCLSCPTPSRPRRQFCQACSDRQAAKARWRAYSTTEEDMERLLASQGGVCVLCQKALILEDGAIDHDHRCCDRDGSCGLCIRGILCRPCNSTLGFIESRVRDPLWVERTLRYVR